MNTYEKRGEGGVQARFGARRSCRRFYAVSPGTAPVAQGGVCGALRIFQDRSWTAASAAAPIHFQAEALTPVNDGGAYEHKLQAENKTKN